MTSKIRLLSYHHIPNNGAFLFVYSLVQHWKQSLSPDTEIIDHRDPQLARYNNLKRFHIFRKIPLFNMKRAALWQREIESHLSLDRSFPRTRDPAKILAHYSTQAEAVATGMDVWGVVKDYRRPDFPNIYWLPQKMGIPKIAFAVSAYYSDLELIRQNGDKLRDYLNDFDVIGARDEFTLQLAADHRTRPDGLIERIPDATFLYEIKDTGIAEKFTKLGIDLNRPILGLLLFGQNELSHQIKEHYHNKGYQIAALSMYNPSADFNLGHLLTPFEWAEAFRLFSFCITDRFHGTIFCLKNQGPFISLEQDQYLPLSQSKIHDLLISFGLGECFVNPYAPDFEPTRFLQHCDEIEKAWETNFKPNVFPQVQKNQAQLENFTAQIKNHLSL